MTDAPQDIAVHKAAARRFAAEARAGAHAADSALAADAVADAFLARFPPQPDRVVSGYWPIGTEIDPRPLLLRLHEAGAPCALPTVIAPGAPLAFRRWTPDAELFPGPFRVPSPGSEAEALRPDVVLAPMLAFDRRGMRLGYGAGFYDRTLAQLRQGGTVLAVGLAFAAQELPEVPVDAFDAPLDAVLTEREFIDLR